MIVNLHHEEDIVWMVKALYYLEEIEQNLTPIKNWEEYQASKIKKKEELKER